MGLLVVCAAMGMLAVLRPARPAPFIVLHKPVEMPVPLRNRVGRWIPATQGWAWAWRVEGGVFGRRKPVNIQAEVVSLADGSRAALSSLTLGPAGFSDTNGLEVWLLGGEQLKSLREHLKQTHGTELLFRPRISTADGIEGRMFQGEMISSGGSTNQVGIALGCYARVRPGTTDLIACITLSEPVTNEAVAPKGSPALPSILIQTNLDAAVRVQIPKGSGLFLLDGSTRESRRKPIGVIIDPL